MVLLISLLCPAVCGVFSVCVSSRLLMPLDSQCPFSPPRPARTIAFVHNTGSAPATVPAASSLPARSGCVSNKRSLLSYLRFVRPAQMNEYIFPLCPLHAPPARSSSPQALPASSASLQNSFTFSPACPEFIEGLNCLSERTCPEHRRRSADPRTILSGAQYLRPRPFSAPFTPFTLSHLLTCPALSLSKGLPFVARRAKKGHCERSVAISINQSPNSLIN